MIRVGCARMDLKRGTQIAYIPHHAVDSAGEPDLNHVAVEFGFVTSTNKKLAFCRYWSKYEKDDLRTKANSEGTPFDRLIIITQKPRYCVSIMLQKYC